MSGGLGGIMEWISVEDRLPEEKTPVLVANTFGVDIAFAQEGFWYTQYDECKVHVTHWMPLPDPPYKP